MVREDEAFKLSVNKYIKMNFSKDSKKVAWVERSIMILILIDKLLSYLIVIYLDLKLKEDYDNIYNKNFNLPYSKEIIILWFFELVNNFNYYKCLKNKRFYLKKKNNL